MNLRERRFAERAKKIAARVFYERQRGIPTTYPVLDEICAPPADAPRALDPVPPTVVVNAPPRNEDK